uniref:Uncharacterized protein n=1 Tax=Candidozyma auris TaxID=498019 RepID=A0A0L0NXV2_CANAR
MKFREKKIENFGWVQLKMDVGEKATKKRELEPN